MLTIVFIFSVFSRWFIADYDVVFSYGAILFAGVEGLVSILIALGARTDSAGVGMCHGFTLNNPHALSIAVGNGSPLLGTSHFGAGLQIPVGHYKGRRPPLAPQNAAVDTDWSLHLRCGVSPDSMIDFSVEQRAAGSAYYGRSTSCPVVLFGGYVCRLCTKCSDNARRLRAPTSVEVEVVSRDHRPSPAPFTPQQAKDSDTLPHNASTSSMSTGARFIASPVFQRRRTYRNYDCSKAAHDVSILKTQLGNLRTLYEDACSEIARLSKDKCTLLPPAEQEAVAYILGYAQTETVEQGIKASGLSSTLASLIRWCVHKMVAARALGKAQHQERFPVEVIPFALDLYMHHSRAVSPSIPHTCILFFNSMLVFFWRVVAVRQVAYSSPSSMPRYT
jgi:hypothetical protein